MNTWLKPQMLVFMKQALKYLRIKIFLSNVFSQGDFLKVLSTQNNAIRIKMERQALRVYTEQCMDK